MRVGCGESRVLRGTNRIGREKTSIDAVPPRDAGSPHPTEVELRGDGHSFGRGSAPAYSLALLLRSNSSSR